jgi:predicted transcriptional regulator
MVGSSQPRGITYGVKKGYKEMFETIDKHKGATWTELKKASHVSTRTLAKRIKEAKEHGYIEEDIRKPNGKKVYKAKLE